MFFLFFSILSTVGIVLYGEIEYYLGWFKIFSLAICFFISFLVNVGAFGNGYIGFKYWNPPEGNGKSVLINGRRLTEQDQLSMGSMGLVKCLFLPLRIMLEQRLFPWLRGRRKNPEKPFRGRAPVKSPVYCFTDWNSQGVNAVVYRILFVYIGLIFFQGIICPSNSPELLNATSKVASSPFTIAFTNAGWKSSGHFINTLIIIAFISSGNGTIYVQSRALYSLALSGRAPRFFATTSKKGGTYSLLNGEKLNLLRDGSTIRSNSHIMHLGLSGSHEHQHWRWPSLQIPNFRRRVRSLHCLERDHLHTSPHAQRSRKTRNPSLNVPVQSFWEHLDLSVQFVSEPIFAADSGIYGV